MQIHRAGRLSRRDRLKIIFVMWQRQASYDDQYHLAAMARQQLRQPQKKIA